MVDTQGMAGLPVKFDKDLKLTGWEATVAK